MESTGDQRDGKEMNETSTASTDNDSKKVDKKRVREWLDRYRALTKPAGSKAAKQQPTALSLTKTRSILLFGLILILYLLVNIAASVIAPFFPEQV